MSEEQMQLVRTREIPHQKVRALAGVLAGFRWPDRGAFEKLKQKQRQAAMETARMALERLDREDD